MTKAGLTRPNWSLVSNNHSDDNTSLIVKVARLRGRMDACESKAAQVYIFFFFRLDMKRG